jgi:4a-hydroxytetrahydrobiopterin dehydratase
MGLSKQTCVPCREGVPPLKGKPLQDLHSQLKPGWKVVDEHHIEREFPFKDFKQALAFTNRIGQLAEEQGHHPDITTSWGKVKVVLWTHKIKGLSESDFVLAAKIDELQ